MAGAADQQWDPVQVAQQLAARIPAIPGTMLLFVSPEVDVLVLLDELGTYYPDATFFGCSSSGVLGDGQIAASGVSAILVPEEDLSVFGFHFEVPANEAGWQEIVGRVSTFERELGLHLLRDPAAEGVAILFSAGLQQTEETVTARMHLALPDIPLVGATASDGLRFEATYVIVDGRVVENQNLILVCRCRLGLTSFQHHHFVPTDKQAVITDVVGSSRKVRTIDGRPARLAYAELVGLEPDQLTVPAVSKYPVAVRIQDRWYIRSVYRIEGDDLIFASALEQGAVVTVMTPVGIREQLGRLVSELQGASGVLLFNCLGRFLEMEADGNRQECARLLEGLPVAGLNTYGEQYMGLHLNHTLTGVRFG